MDEAHAKSDNYRALDSCDIQKAYQVKKSLFRCAI
jgi:hypothetical protein